jgi:hypothetical protein
MEWHPFYYNGEETNIEVNELGEVRRVYKNWLKKRNSEKLAKLSIHHSGYLLVGFKTVNVYKNLYVHKIMAMVFLNHIPCGMDFVVDHIDRNKRNNCLINLRIVNNRENTTNRKDKSKYGTGVYKKCKKYAAAITYQKRIYHIGTYNTPEEASEVYNQKLRQIEAGVFI